MSRPERPGQWQVVAGEGPDGPRVLPHLVGPASLLGTCLGMLATGTAWVVDGPLQLLFGVPLIGAVLLPIPGALRHLGTGLLASLGVWFSATFGLAAMVLTLEVLGQQ